MLSLRQMNFLVDHMTPHTSHDRSHDHLLLPLPDLIQHFHHFCCIFIYHLEGHLLLSHYLKPQREREREVVMIVLSLLCLTHLCLS